MKDASKDYGQQKDSDSVKTSLDSHDDVPLPDLDKGAMENKSEYTAPYKLIVKPRE